MEWSNIKPTEEGIYWHVERRWIDGVEDETVGPCIVEVAFDYKGDVDLMYPGSDDPGGIVFDENEANIMIYERNEPREFSFTWDDEKTRQRKMNDRVIRKSEHWLMKVDEPLPPDSFK